MRRYISTTVYLEPRQVASLREIAERTQIPSAALIRKAVTLVIAREGLRAAALKKSARSAPLGSPSEEGENE